MSNREIANLLILLFLAAVLVASRTGRGLVLSLAKIVLGRLLVVYFFYSAYLAVAIFAAYEISIWEKSQVKDTALWLAMAGTAIFGTFGEVGRYPKVLRKRVLEMVGAGAVVEFVFNLVSFPLLVELLIAVGLTVLYMLLAVSSSRAETKGAAVVIQLVLVVLLLGILVATALSLFQQRDTLKPAEQWRSFAMIFWLPVVACPAIYLIGAFSLYETFFKRVRRLAPDRSLRLLLLVASQLRLRVRLIRGVGGRWLSELAAQESREGGRTVIRAFGRTHSAPLTASAGAESLKLERALETTKKGPSGFPASLVSDRPPAWEFQLYVLALSRILEAVDIHVENLGKGPTLFQGRLRDVGETVRHAGDMLERATRLASELPASVDQSEQEVAFGEPGQPGDARQIIRLASALGCYYARFRELERTVEAYEVRPYRQELARLQEATTRMCSEPIQQITDFVAQFSAEVATMPERIELGEPIELEMVLTLEVSEEVCREYDAALDAVRRSHA